MITQIASRYAEAMFDLAEEENQVSEIYSEIFDLNSVIDSNRNLYDVLRSPFITKAEKKAVIDKLFKGKVSDFSLNFLKVLVDNSRTTELSSIVSEYKLLLDEKNNVLEGVVTTAIALTEEQIRKLEETLSAKYEKSIRLTNKVDTSIIGGVLIKIGNEEIDGSIKTKLETLKDELSEVIQ